MGFRSIFNGKESNDMGVRLVGMGRGNTRLEGGVPWSCIKTAFTKELRKEYSGLNNVLQYIGTPNFQTAMGNYGIKIVCADNAAKRYLDNHKLAEKLLQNSRQPLNLTLMLNLMQVFSGTHVKIIFDKEQHKIYFLRSKENLRSIFSPIGAVPAELLPKLIGDDCPTIHELKRFLRGLIPNPSKIKLHTDKCPHCKDAIDMIDDQ